MEKQEYPDIRNLDNYTVRIFRDNKWQLLAFTDLTKKEQKEFLDSSPESTLRAIIKDLAENLRSLGDELEVYRLKNHHKSSEIDFF